MDALLEEEDISTWLPAATTTSLTSAVAEAAPADGVDRISSLPDNLLRNIVSRLPVRDGVLTAVLASRWYSLWLSTPLVLRDSDLLLASDLDDEVALAVGFAAVGCILADHPGPFRKIQLTCCEFGTRERELEEWARLLAAKGVQDLVLLDVDDSTKDDVLQRLPKDILRCASLQRLFLGYWSFPAMSTDVAFPHLKKLGMQNTSMRDEDLDHILACSPVLQILALKLSKSPERIRLRSKSLQCMVLWTATHPVDYAKTKTSPNSIVPSVKILALKANFSSVNDVKMLLSYLRCFPNVEMLHIELPLDVPTVGTLALPMESPTTVAFSVLVI
ncbi:hypothetical protein PR202_ga10614 [Eleusine coracana subsp. coracana]|uniref:F-box domain-containing protein n=1 Tax=Eleusine coracana subsp. coracana TaxID=191504 RepID=A0AAV5C794_ELECO|nr:hypothetical protein PR202_ga10614 [Eleusine coracana subsp. coracana]